MSRGPIFTSMKSSMDVLAAVDAGARFDVYVLDVRLQRGEPHGLALAKMLEKRQPSAAFIFVTGDPGLAALDSPAAPCSASRSILPLCGKPWPLERACTWAGRPDHERC